VCRSAWFCSCLNCLGHALVYSYYALSTVPSLKQKLWWKRYDTTFQLVRLYTFTLPLPLRSGAACYRHTLRPPVGPMRNPILNQKVIRIEVLANLKNVAECSCLSSHGLSNGHSKYCIRRTIVALHLPRNCRLVSCSSSHRGHEASLCLFNRAGCRVNV